MSTSLVPVGKNIQHLELGKKVYYKNMPFIISEPNPEIFKEQGRLKISTIHLKDFSLGERLPTIKVMHSELFVEQ